MILLWEDDLDLRVLLLVVDLFSTWLGTAPNPIWVL